MAERRVKIGSSVGLHARPANLFCSAAKQQPVKVQIATADGTRGPVDAASILSVMGMGVQSGEEVVLTAADGAEGEAAVAELAELLAQDLDATPA
ncbi:HPr family phosphocarrier protein [Pseudonocardia sp. C8]|uniref:HPr family phosphocarrier protein n=1 Tax=Pseudonocardia sp. C8 TaxID=2762759 RepID=UPI00164369FB|nr:HPr family phosphocarrier protein [Pseudonocardia sp. C8]MBC3194776.1 HPr family phosphocarrier protein [Pseudonocardia sp. C8]